MIGQTSIAAASATTGTDLLRNETWNISSKRRVLKGIALVGSAAINDFSADLFVEEQKIGTFYNTHAGVASPLTDSDTVPLGQVYVPPGSKISLIANGNATTNPVVIRIY